MAVLKEKSLRYLWTQILNKLNTKLDKPSAPPAVGDFLKVISVNEDGSFVCAWAEAPNSKEEWHICDTVTLEEGTKTVRFDLSTVLSENDELTDIYIFMHAQSVIATGTGNITVDNVNGLVGFFGSNSFSTSLERFVIIHTFAMGGKVYYEMTYGSGNNVSGNPMSLGYNPNPTDNLKKSRIIDVNINATMAQGNTVQCFIKYRKA